MTRNMIRPTTRPTIRLTAGLCAVVALVAVSATNPASAGPDQESIVEQARHSVQRVARHTDIGPTMRSLLKKAKAVVIFPAILKGAFFVGAEGGSGVLLAKGKNGQWSYPAFYTMGGASFGLQIGGQSSEVVLLIMTSKGINSVIDNKVKLGGDVSVAVGPIGLGAEASTTTNLRADIYSFSQNAGAYIGASVEGSVIQARQSWNADYYKSENATPKAIVLNGKYINVHADPLRKALSEIK